MVYAIVIQARMSSQRLPGKVLQDVNGRPMLARMLERVRNVRGVEHVVLATSIDSSDDPIASFCASEGVRCFRGSLEDVLDRYYQAAKALHPDVVIRLTGDCPLIDPLLVEQMMADFEDKSLDYYANCAPPPGTFPDGMDVEIFTFNALERAWREAVKPSDREHVTFYFWHNPDKFRIGKMDLPEDLSAWRLTVDYPEDLEIVRNVYQALYSQDPRFGMQAILNYLTKRPEIRGLNQGIKRNQGWESAFKKDREKGWV